MLGPNTRVCQSGQWSGSPPVCSKYIGQKDYAIYLVFTSFMNGIWKKPNENNKSLFKMFSIFRKIPSFKWNCRVCLAG